MECMTGISRSSVPCIAKNDIGSLYSRAKECSYFKLPQSKRLKCCWSLLRMYTPMKAPRIWFSDEKIFALAALLNHQDNRVYSNKSKKKGYWIGSSSSTKKSLQQTCYVLWIHFKDWKRFVALCKRRSDCWWQLLLENPEETFLCNKEIIWWTKVHYSTR